MNRLTVISSIAVLAMTGACARNRATKLPDAKPATQAKVNTNECTEGFSYAQFEKNERELAVGLKIRKLVVSVEHRGEGMAQIPAHILEESNANPVSSVEKTATQDCEKNTVTTYDYSNRFEVATTYKISDISTSGIMFQRTRDNGSVETVKLSKLGDSYFMKEVLVTGIKGQEDRTMQEIRYGAELPTAARISLKFFDALPAEVVIPDSVKSELELVRSYDNATDVPLTMDSVWELDDAVYAYVSGNQWTGAQPGFVSVKVRGASKVQEKLNSPNPTQKVSCEYTLSEDNRASFSLYFAKYDAQPAHNDDESRAVRSFQIMAMSNAMEGKDRKLKVSSEMIGAAALYQEGQNEPFTLAKDSSCTVRFSENVLPAVKGSFGCTKLSNKAGDMIDIKAEFNCSASVTKH